MPIRGAHFLGVKIYVFLPAAKIYFSQDTSILMKAGGATPSCTPKPPAPSTP